MPCVWVSRSGSAVVVAGVCQAVAASQRRGIFSFCRSAPCKILALGLRTLGRKVALGFFSLGRKAALGFLSLGRKAALGLFSLGCKAASEILAFGGLAFGGRAFGGPALILGADREPSFQIPKLGG